jgi:N-acetylmuramoyl-L-alanine amidase
MGCAGAASLSAYAVEVRAVRLGVHPDKVRMVLELSGPSDFRAFVLDDPTRIIIDLPEFSWTGGSLQNAPGSGIAEMRHGTLQAGISRLVFDTQSPVLLKSAFVLPPQDGAGARLVVDFAAAPGMEAFQAGKSNVLGTLEVTPSFLRAPDSAAHPAPSQGSEARLAGSYEGRPTPKPRKAQAVGTTPVYKPLIVIDPGHGGDDPGAKGANGVNEKQVTLALSKELRDQLEGTGRYRVILTRERDMFIKLGERVKFARQNEADLFISIHADSIDKPHVGGASVYTLSDKASDEQTAKLAARENQVDLIGGFDLDTQDEEVATILVDLAMRDTMNQSRFFAGSIVDTLAYKGIRVLERPHRYAGFAVLKAPDIPSILVEAGFMSNKREADLLSSQEHRAKIAEALVRGVDTYFEAVSGER